MTQGPLFLGAWVEGLFLAAHCLAAPHPDPLPAGEREQKGAWR